MYRFCETVRPMLSDRCLSVCNVGVLWPNGWMDKLGMQVRLGSGDIVLDGDPAPLHKKGAEAPNFRLISIYCGQTPAGWITMSLGMEVCPSHNCARWGRSTPPQKGGGQISGPSLLWPNGCMHQDTTWYGGSPQPMTTLC